MLRTFGFCRKKSFFLDTRLAEKGWKTNFWLIMENSIRRFGHRANRSRPAKLTSEYQRVTKPSKDDWIINWLPALALLPFLITSRISRLITFASFLLTRKVAAFKIHSCLPKPQLPRATRAKNIKELIRFKREQTEISVYDVSTSSSPPPFLIPHSRFTLKLDKQKARREMFVLELNEGIYFSWTARYSNLDMNDVDTFTPQSDKRSFEYKHE